MLRPCVIAATVVSLTLAGCSTPTQPLQSAALLAKQGVPRSVSQSTGSLGGTDGDRSHDPRATGAFRHDDFVITVHGVRLLPDYRVYAAYDVDATGQGPLEWANVDFVTTEDGKLWTLTLRCLRPITWVSRLSRMRGTDSPTPFRLEP